MSDRFNALKSNNKNLHNERSENKKNNHEKNTFKQKKPKSRDYSNNNNSNNNRFTKNSKEREEFTVKVENFPELVKNVVDNNNISINIEEKTYLEKIRETKYQNQKKELVPRGWTILKKGINAKKKEEEINLSEYYNPSLALEIIYNREKYREELNELLGDISPYWNTIIESDDEDDDEDYDYNDNEDYNSSDYCDDF